MIWSALKEPWPWYVSGPLIGLLVPLLLLLGNKPLGVSSSLRALCAALAPSRAEFFRYDWKRSGVWNIAFACGILLGGAFAVVVLNGGGAPEIAGNAKFAMSALGLSAPAGLVPAELLGWQALLTLRGATCIIGGGFLVGFGSSYAGGCTSGHGVLGLATFQLASVIALLGIFAGGLLTTFILLPLIL